MDDEFKVIIYGAITALAAFVALVTIAVGGILVLLYGINAIFT